MVAGGGGWRACGRRLVGGACGRAVAVSGAYDLAGVGLEGACGASGIGSEGADEASHRPSQADATSSSRSMAWAIDSMRGMRLSGKSRPATTSSTAV